MRNNLLFAAAQVNVPAKGVTLFEACCKQLSLAASHPLFKEMEQGFPPPFYLYMSAGKSGKEPYIIRKNEVLSFSLVLVGEFSSCIPYFIQAIRYM